jgi:hypothetical protein
MKYLKGVLNVLVAVSLMALLSSCCCHRSRQSTCLNLVQNGSFEDPHLDPLTNSYGPLPVNGGWVVSGTPALLIVNHGTPQAPQTGLNYVFEFYNTPEGFQSVSIGNTNFAPVTVAQTITTELEAGKTYHLSFWQSAYAPNTNDNDYFVLPGKVRVQLVLANSPTPVYDQIFCVPAGSKWLPQPQAGQPSGVIHITTGGTYTLKFSSLGRVFDPAIPKTSGTPLPANIDDVSLCEQH